MMRRRPSDWKVFTSALGNSAPDESTQSKSSQSKSAQSNASDTRTRPTDVPAQDARSTVKDGAGDLKSGATQTASQGMGTVSSISLQSISGDRNPHFHEGRSFERRVSYGDNPRLALFAPPRWPGGGGRSARRSAKS
jgi:hypothetical protein